MVTEVLLVPQVHNVCILLLSLPDPEAPCTQTCLISHISLTTQLKVSPPGFALHQEESQPSCPSKSSVIQAFETYNYTVQICFKNQLQNIWKLLQPANSVIIKH